MRFALRAATAVYRFLLLLFPAAFRRSYGAEMGLLFRERCERAAQRHGLSGLLICALRGWGDVIRGAMADRLHAGSFYRSRNSRRGAGMLSGLLHELRISVRTFVREPGFTLTVLLTLGIGIGATTAIFGLVNSAVLRPLPYPRAGQIMSIVQSDDRFGLVPFAIPYLQDFRGRLQQFESVAGFTSSWSLTLTGTGEPRRITASYISDGVFEMLGARLEAGRNITLEEHASSTARVVLVSRAFWEREFGLAIPFEERIIRLDDTPHAIVGILAGDVRMPIVSSIVNESRTSAELWLPLATNDLSALRNTPIMNVIGRLRTGVSPAQAQAEIDAVAAVLAREHPQLADGGPVRVLPLRELVSRDVRQPLLLLFGAVGGLLLIACANVGNLLLARSAGRTGDLAVRVSLGASRARLVRQMLLESFVLSSAGALLGLGLAWLCLLVFPALGLEQLPPSARLEIDAFAAAFAAGCGVLTALLTGVVPALQATRRAPHLLLKEGGRTTTSRGLRARQTLVVSEVALSLILLVMAGLLARSFWTLAHVDAGIRAERVLAGGVALPASRYATAESKLRFVEDALTRLQATGGVERAALVNRLPFGGSNVLVGVELEGQPPATNPPTVDRRVVSSDYFATMDIPVLAGRSFASEDRATDAGVAIVNAAAAQRYWENGQALGRRVRLMLRGGPGPWLRIVGIVGDVRHHGLDRPAEPEIYVPYAQAPVESFVLLLRTARDPMTLAPVLRATVQALDPDLPLQNTGVAADAIAASIAEPKTRALLFNAFAVIALLLAAIGVYGVSAYTVASRRRDIGIRLAFGAQRREIFQLVVREGMTLVAIGTCIGVLGSVALTRLLRAQLFGISATDPLTFAGVTAILVLVALVAHAVPARRAMRLDPIQALHVP